MKEMEDNIISVLQNYRRSGNPFSSQLGSRGCTIIHNRELYCTAKLLKPQDSDIDIGGDKDEVD